VLVLSPTSSLYELCGTRRRDYFPLENRGPAVGGHIHFCGVIYPSTKFRRQGVGKALRPQREVAICHTRFAKTKDDG